MGRRLSGGRNLHLFEFQLFHILAMSYYFLVVLIVAILMGMRSYLMVVLIDISLMTNDGEYVFMCLLPICISSLDKCQVLWPFFNQIVLLLLSFRIFLYIPNVSILLYIWFEIFYPILWVTFLLLIVPFFFYFSSSSPPSFFFFFLLSFSSPSP